MFHILLLFSTMKTILAIVTAGKTTMLHNYSMAGHESILSQKMTGAEYRERLNRLNRKTEENIQHASQSFLSGNITTRCQHSKEKQC